MVFIECRSDGDSEIIVMMPSESHFNPLSRKREEGKTWEKREERKGKAVPRRDGDERSV